MSLDAEDYAALAKDAYKDERKADYLQHNSITAHGRPYKVFDYAATATGFHATAYQQVDPPHNIVIAYRGTDPDWKHHPMTTIQDGAVDAIMVADKFNAQELDARRFTEEVLEKAARLGIPRDRVTVAGHSLGGTLAEVEAWRFGLRGETFNAYGAAGLYGVVPEGGSQVIDNVLADDVVSCGHHFGIERRFATAQDIDSLKAAGYFDPHPSSNPMRALAAARFSDHSIDNFAPDEGEGASVLTATNEMRAKQYAGPITFYRDNTVALRENLRMQAHLPGSPVFAAANTARLTEASITVAGYIGSASTRAAHAIAQEAAHEVQAVQHTAQRMSEAVIQAAHTTGHKVQDAQAGISLLLNDLRHPEYALYQSAYTAVRQMEAERGVPSGEHSKRLAGALTVSARRDGLNRIDQVALTHDSRKAYAVEGDPKAPLRKLTHVDTAQAVQTTLEQSSAAMHEARQQTLERQALQHAQQQALQHQALQQPAQQHAAELSR